MGTLAKKWEKIVEKLPEFKDTADAASVDDLKKMIVTCEGNIYTVEKSIESDTKLQGAKELVKSYMEPYREGIKVQTAKIKYMMSLLDEKGENLEEKE